MKKSGIWDIGGEKISDLGYGDPCKPGENVDFPVLKNMIIEVSFIDLC